MISVRYKELKSGKFSAYLDIYMKSDGKGKRNYEFLGIYVNKDYSNPKSRVIGDYPKSGHRFPAKVVTSFHSKMCTDYPLKCAVG
ncbi:Arm DNA-binding domain-containing protein [Pedobacter agri]|uniref:Arm DNA-binding domain-containing protein n=1 Tax=Pedobacter agri TaxID=454586 RepID=UPI00292CC58A|nr:Arm DNA-binding domain-containing protein [Pedobacter agri]